MKRFLSAISLALLAASCGSASSDSTNNDRRIMDGKEREVCHLSGIDTALVLELHENARFSLSVFLPDSILKFDSEGNLIAGRPDLHGVMFEVSADAASQLCTTFGPKFLAKGQTLYVFRMNFGIDNENDGVAIVNTSDKYKILKETATDGINYDITNDSLLTIIHRFDEQYNLSLTGAGMDWCQFTIGNEPADWNAFAQEVYEVCPDVVDQGTGSVEDLAAEMKRTGTLYLWWD